MSRHCALALVALVACGDDAGTPIDAPGAELDAAFDAPDAVELDAPPDAEADAAVDGPPEDLVGVRITVELAGVPQSGARILMNRVDGTLFGEGVTDGSGVYDAQMPDGGSLTWVRPRAPRPIMQTYTALHAGDVVNAGTPRPRVQAAGPTTISITRTPMPTATTVAFGIGGYPSIEAAGDSFSYVTTATGTVTVIQDGRDKWRASTGYSLAQVEVTPGAAVTMPATLHQADDLVVNVSGPYGAFLDEFSMIASVLPFEDGGALVGREGVTDETGHARMVFPRFVYSAVDYRSSLSLYSTFVETLGSTRWQEHFVHRTIGSATHEISLAPSDRAECVQRVALEGPGMYGTHIAITEGPEHADFLRLGHGDWNVVVPRGTTRVARIEIPADLVPTFEVSGAVWASTLDSGDVDYRTVLSLQRSRHYPDRYTDSEPHNYAGEGYAWMSECWWFPRQPGQPD